MHGHFYVLDAKLRTFSASNCNIVGCGHAGLGVAKFLVQLGVFASVLYTLLALDIDPVEQLLKLLPISEVCMLLPLSPYLAGIFRVRAMMRNCH